MRPLYLLFITIVSLLVFNSCGPTYKLKENESILRGIHMDIDGTISYQEKNKIKEELDYIYPQKPNTYIFNIFPYKSYLYNLRYQKYQQDSFNFQIINGIVEKPVIYDSSAWEEIPKLAKTYFQNQGYFDAEIEKSIKKRKKKVHISYQVKTNAPYIISEHVWEHFPEQLNEWKEDLIGNTSLKIGSKYNNALLESERKRIVDFLRNKGFYGITLDHVRFELDTLNVASLNDDPVFNKQAILNYEFNPEFKYIKVFTYLADSVVIEDNQDILKPYTINKVNIFGNYSGYGIPNKEDYQYQKHHDHDYYFLENYVNPNVIDRHLFLRSGQLFSEKKYTKTLRQLSDLGIFKYSAIHFNEVDSQKLNVDIYLDPYEKYDFHTSIELSGGDLYTVGSALQVSLINKNFLKGANRLSGTLSYGVELEQNKQLSNEFFKQFFLHSQNIGLSFKLEFPKFLLPVNPERFSRNALPRTSINLGGNYMERFQYLKLFNISSSLQYHWRESTNNSWTVTPLYINSLHLRSVHPSFQMRMDTIPAIKNAYQETFIQGERIEYQHFSERSRHLLFLKIGMEEAGLIVGGLQNLFNEGQGKVAQFVRLDWDTKWYQQFGRSQWILRFQGGWGLPYGNSTVLPYIKQFYVGGPYSIRGWLPRYLGPGSYNVQKYQAITDHLFIDQAGDVKLEMNVEYRFPIVQLFRGGIGVKGAAFMDAGNIWLTKEDNMLPGAQFKLSELGQDIAISTGAGLRLDLGGIFIVRLDWAFPIKKPYISDQYGWVLKDIQFSDKTWRKENLNLNIAIGYPF